MKDKQPQGTTGEELFRRYLAGDNDAFEALVALYDDELHYFINRTVDDYYEAKTLTIEAFAQLAVGGKKFAEKSSLKTYLFTIGKNLASRYIKQRVKEEHLPYEDAIGLLLDESDTPDRYMEMEENRQLLHKVMRELKDDHRIILILLYFEDMSYKQAGQAMRKSESQIRNLAYRAKSALKRKLENEGFTRV